MQITIATGLYPPEIGGPATYAAMFENELPQYGFTIKTVPFSVVRQYPKIIRHVVYTWKLWQASLGSGLIYALDPTSVGLSALLVSKMRQEPFLVRLGGDYAWEQGRIRFGITDSLDDFLLKRDTWPWAVKCLAGVQTFVVNRAKLIIVPSAYLKGVVTAWGVRESQIKVIYSSLYPLRVSGTQQELREKCNYQYPMLVSAGRLVPWKGFEALIDVVAQLRQYFPHIVLVIVGEGEERPHLEAKVALLQLTSHVRFTGSLSKEALGATIKAADVFVLNTAYEGLSHQLIEVMDIGTPIVTTDAGGNTELITDGENGLLVPFNNSEALGMAIMQILNHPESRERLVQSAQARATLFAKEVVVQEIVTVLKKYHG